MNEEPQDEEAVEEEKIMPDMESDDNKPADEAAAEESVAEAAPEEQAQESDQAVSETPEAAATAMNEAPVETAEQSEESNDGEEEGQEAKSIVSAPKKSSPKPTIILAILIALVLAGLGYMAYTTSEDDSNPDTSAQTEQTAETPASTLDASGPVDDTVIDNEVTEIDQTLDEIDAIEDVDDGALSDENLGI